MSVGFRPTEADMRLIEKLKRPGEKTSDVLRRALAALDDSEWQAQARADMERIAASGENLAEEPDEWGYDETGAPVDLRTPITTDARVTSARGVTINRGTGQFTIWNVDEDDRVAALACAKVENHALRSAAHASHRLLKEQPTRLVDALIIVSDWKIEKTAEAEAEHR